MLIRLPFETYDDQPLICLDESLTHQSFKDECDYNNVLAKWAQSGLITHLNPKQPIYADVSNVTDYQTSLELIRSAQNSFDNLPSSVRDRFNNDPALLLRFLEDPRNRDEAIKLGLITPSVDNSAPPKASDELSTEGSPSGAA